MREAVDPQICEFRNSQNNLYCANCGIDNADKYHVDHITHFEKLVHDFLEINKYNIPTMFKDTYGNTKTFIDKDKLFEESWKKYHNVNAQLRILCAPCNLKRPKWKPLSKSNK